jgi:AcrR family transcriptional regulator
LVWAAGVAQGTFYHHFHSMDDLVAAVGEKLAESFDEVLAPTMLAICDPFERLSFAFAKFLAGATWARLVVQSSQSPAVFGRGAFQGGAHGLQKR